MLSGHDPRNDDLFATDREQTDPSTNPYGLRAPGENRTYSGQRVSDGDQYLNPLFHPESAYLGSDPGFYKQQANRYRQMGEEADTRAGVAANYGFANQSRGMQLGSLALMRSAAQGGQPSAAEAQYQLGMNQAGAAAGYGLAGGGSPLAMVNAQRQGAYMGGQGMTAAGIAAANARSAEDQRALQAYTQSGLGMRGQDIGQSAYDANLVLRNRNLNDQRAMQLYGMEQGTYESQRQALMEQQAMLARLYQAYGNRQDAETARRNAADAAFMDAATGTVMGGTQGTVGMYDRNRKK